MRSWLIGRCSRQAAPRLAEFDQKFEDLFAQRTPEELEAIKQKYGGRDDILEAEARIADVAKDIVKHYVESILPEGFSGLSGKAGPGKSTGGLEKS